MKAERKKVKVKCHIPEVAKPLNKLSGVVLVEFDIWEVNLEDGRAWVSHKEEHKLSLPQVHRGQGHRLGLITGSRSNTQQYDIPK